MKPTDDEIEAAYKWAMSHVDYRGKSPEFRDIAHDAATDAVLWAKGNYHPERGEFRAFAASAVRRFVSRAIGKAVERARNRPRVGEIPEGYAARDLPADGDVPLPTAIRDLPAELRAAVTFFYLYRYDLRDCGLLLGVAPETVRVRLTRAAQLLAPDADRRPRRVGEKRITKG